MPIMPHWFLLIRPSVVRPLRMVASREYGIYGNQLHTHTCTHTHSQTFLIILSYHKQARESGSCNNLKVHLLKHVNTIHTELVLVKYNSENDSYFKMKKPWIFLFMVQYISVDLSESLQTCTGPLILPHYSSASWLFETILKW